MKHKKEETILWDTSKKYYYIDMPKDKLVIAVILSFLISIVLALIVYGYNGWDAAILAFFLEIIFVYRAMEFIFTKKAIRLRYFLKGRIEKDRDAMENFVWYILHVMGIFVILCSKLL